MKITLNGSEKEITFKEYTRWIDKWFKNILYKDFNVGLSDDTKWMTFSPMVLEEANDYLIKSLTELTDDEIMWLSNETYQEILAECKKIQTPPQK